MAARKKPEPEPEAPVETLPEQDPWACTACGAPELERAVRVGARSYCVTCYYEAGPSVNKGRFVSRTTGR